jgi:hypothetical protein
MVTRNNPSLPPLNLRGGEVGLIVETLRKKNLSNRFFESL